MGRNLLLFLLLSLMIKVNGSEVNARVELVIIPSPKSKESNVIYKRAEETLNLTCRISETGSLPQYTLNWDLPFTPQNSKNRVIFGRGPNILTLVVQNLKVSDSGDYNCEAKLNGIVKLREAVTVNVKNKKSFNMKTSCNDKMFPCTPGKCIPRRYMCDGFVDCESGADEAVVYCGPDACQGRIICEDGRCIPKYWCCDQLSDPNCTVKVKPTCCSQWPKVYVDNDHGYLSEQQRYSDMGFLQTTIYTVIGCAMAFMFIVTILVVAICRVHMKRTSTLGGIASVTSSHGVRCSGLANSGSRFPGGGLPRSSATHSLLTHHQPMDPSSNTPLHSLQLYDLDVYLNAATGSGRDSMQNPHGVNPNPHSLLVTYNINNGVQFVGRPVDPPPYCEVMSAPPREGPPPPYVSHEDISSPALNQMPSTQVASPLNSSCVSSGTPLNPSPPSPRVLPPQRSEEESHSSELEPSVVNIESQVTDTLLGPASEERNDSP